MPDLMQALSAMEPIRWIIGKVAAITGDTITLTHDGGLIYEVGVLDQYIPVVGDIVHAIAWSPNGMLVLGSNNQPLVARVPPLPPGGPVTVTPGAPSTSTPSTDAWAAGTALQGPDSVGCWFYPTIAALGAEGGVLNGVILASFTIALTASSGDTVELVLHQNPTPPSGPLILMPDASFRTAAPPVGVSTVIPLPMEWGQRLIKGTALGIGIGGGNATGVWTASAATLTFQPL